MFNSSLGAVKYRVYCTLEGRYFEVWDTHKPTRCPNCPNFDIEVGCISRVNDVPYAVYGNTGSNDCEDGPMQVFITNPGDISLSASNLQLMTDSNVYVTNDNIDVTVLNASEIGGGSNVYFTNESLDVNNLTTLNDPDFVHITNPEDITFFLFTSNITVNTDCNVYFTNERIDVHNLTTFSDPDFVQVTNSNLYITNENIDVTITGQPIDIQNLTSFASPDFVEITNSNLYITNENIDVTITGQPIDIQNLTSFADPDFVEITNSNLYITNENIDVTITGQPIQIENTATFSNPDFVELTNSNIYFTNEQVDVNVKNYRINDFYDVLNVDQRHNVIYNYSEFGINRLRNYVVEVGGATLSNEIGTNYYTLTSSNANDMVAIESNEMAPFEIGFETFNQIGHFQITSLTGSNKVIIGMVDSDLTDGWFFEINVNGLEAVRVRNSVEVERTNQSSFNIDSSLDGTGSSGITWAPIGAFVYGIKMLGQVLDVELGFVTGSTGKHGFAPIHRFNTPSTIDEFNRYTTTPLTVMIDNNGTENLIQAIQLLRITQVIGDFNFQKRITSIHRPGSIFKNITSTSFQPVISIRKKSNFQHIRIELEKMDILAENTMEVAIFFDSPLTGPIWGPIEGTDNNETCIEYDYQSTAMAISSTLGDGIVKLYSMIVTGGGNQTGRTTVTEDLESFRLTFGRNNTLTVGARTLNNNAAIYVNLRVLELW